MPLGLEQRGEHARRGEAGHRVELVDEHLARPSTKKSTRARPAHPARTKASTASSRTRSRTWSGIRGGHDQLHAARRVLGLVVIPARLAAASRISPGCEAIGSSLPSTEHSTSIPLAAASTITSGIVREGRARAQPGALRRAPTRTIPTEEPEPGRLDEHGQPELADLGERGVAVGQVALRRAARGSRPAGRPRVRHQLLEGDLVHAQRRGEHARPDVGNVEALEQALDGPVLAERPVQDREHDVGARDAAPGTSAQLSPSRRQTPSRPISMPTPRGRPSRRPSRTEAAEASETSCSEERPPPSTATRSALTVVGVVGVSAWSASSASSWSSSASWTGRRRSSRRCPSSPSCRPDGLWLSTIPSLRWLGHRLGLLLDREAGRWSGCLPRRGCPVP